MKFTAHTLQKKRKAKQQFIAWFLTILMVSVALSIVTAVLVTLGI